MPQVSKGEPIQFSVGAVADAQSRTVYVDDYQLEWNIGDKIKIWCNEPSPKSVDYVVVDTIYSEHGGAITPTGTDTLKWGELGISYTFYSAYPANRVTDVSNIANGEFGMEYITNQLDTVVSLSNGAYLTNPDMNNAYMMAKQEVTPNTSQHHVELYFDPIIGIINPVTVTGVSVIMPHKIKTDRFTYDANGGTTADEGEIKEDDIDKGVSQSVYVGVRNGTSRYVDLHEGETLNLMAFLPPVEMSGKDVKMMVHTTAMNYVLTVPGDQITKQNKYFIQLPDMSPYDDNTNNWMSELDPSTPLNKLSIPAYVCTGDESEADITRLLKKGVRAFDINKFCDEKILGTQCDINEVFTSALAGFLNSDNNEIVIIWLNNASRNLRVEDALNSVEGLKDIWVSPVRETDDSGLHISSPIQSFFTKKLIVVKKNTSARHGGWFNRENEDPTVEDLARPRTDLFPYKDVTSESLSMSEDWWGAQFVAENADSINKKLYEYISAYDEQAGCTGIVTVPYAKDTYVSGQYTYSDLLIQSIIDCNFKFRH